MKVLFGIKRRLFCLRHFPVACQALREVELMISVAKPLEQSAGIECDENAVILREPLQLVHTCFLYYGIVS